VAENFPNPEQHDSATTTTSGTPRFPPRASQTPIDQPPKKKRSFAWVWLILLALVGLVGFRMYQNKQSAAQAAKQKAAMAQRGVPISTTTATKGPIGVYINALGTVTPVYTATITSRVDGQIVSVNYREGQMVHKGDLLIQIDPRPYQAALTQAEGTLAHDEALLAEGRIDLNRYQEAFNRNAIAKQQLDDQVQTVKQVEGSVKNDQGTVAAATTNVDYTGIRAPIEGRVGLRLLDPGNIVTSGSTTPLVVVTQLQPITVIFSVAEDYLPQIQKQMKTGHKMSVDALDRDQLTKLASGSLLTLDNQIDTSTGTVKLKAIFQNGDLTLFPNQFVNARLLVDTQQDATLIPAAAIQRNAQNAFVYLIKPDQTAAVQNVTVGTTDGNTSAVQGIQPGDVVAMTGFDKLQDGVKVTVRNGNGSGPGAGSEQNSPAASRTGAPGAGTGSGSNPGGTATGASRQ
jgi:membrane fusion protein, multidrug efflux system